MEKFKVGDIIRPSTVDYVEYLVLEIFSDYSKLLLIKNCKDIRYVKVGTLHEVEHHVLEHNKAVFIRKATKAEMVLYVPV